MQMASGHGSGYYDPEGGGGDRPGMPPSGLSMILMVHQTLKNADESTRQAYIEGRVNPNANQSMRRIYDMEKMGSTVFSQILGVPQETHRQELDLYQRELVPESVSALPPEIDPVTDPFTPREGKALTWSKVNMTLMPTRRDKQFKNKEPRKLLDNIWGECPPAMTTAIMGPSGAGKTSVLNILAGRASNSSRINITFDIRLNNYAVDPADIEVRQLIAFVAQDDSLVGTQTPRECIRFSAKLRLPRSTTDAELDGITKRMLAELGLNSCADTVVGHALLKGISGGERKRTSVGVELVVKPGMIFLDEPTSGLDSFSAVQVCQVLKKVARAGATVAFTIHQPSSDVFMAFDRVILLNKGRLMYHGLVGGVVPYFAERGFPCPNNHNPADWIMTVAQAKSADELDVAGFFEEDTREMGAPFTAAHGTDALGRTIHKSSARDGIDERTPGPMTQFVMLLHREFQKTVRDIGSLIARLFVSIIQACLIGSVFYQSGTNSKYEPVAVMDHFGAIMITCTMALLGQVQPSLMAFPEERPVFVREYSTSHYGVVPYFFAKLIYELVLVAVQLFLILAIIFALVDFRGSFFSDYLIAYAVGITGGAMGIFIGALAKGNRQVATQFLPLIIIPNMMFSGFFVAIENIPVFLRWIQHISPLGYALRLIVLQEFLDCAEGTADIETNNVTVAMEIQARCRIVVEDNATAEEDEAGFYWFMMLLLFCGFRIGGLWVLKRSASVFL